MYILATAWWAEALIAPFPQVSKALLADYFTAIKRKLPIKSVGLEHMNKPRFIVPAQLESSTLRSPEFQVSVAFISS